MSLRKVGQKSALEVGRTKVTSGAKHPWFSRPLFDQLAQQWEQKPGSRKQSARNDSDSEKPLYILMGKSWN